MAKKKSATGGLETFDIKQRVIFSAGVHNGDLYTEEDLQKMEDAFYACKGKLRPPLKLGHNEVQALWQMDGMPAIGWVDNVRKLGSDLVADLINIPRAIYELIEVGAYRTMSAEIYWNAVVDGKKYPYALKALSLLGADIPAVKTVSDLLALYNEKYAAAYSDMEGEVKTYEGATPDKENSMTKTPEQIAEEAAAAAAATAAAEKEAADKVAADKAAADAAAAATVPALAAVVEKLEAAVAALTEKKAKHEAAIKELTEKLTASEKSYAEVKAALGKHETEKKFTALEAKVDALITGKKMLPAHKPMVLKLLSFLPLETSYKEGELETTVEKLIFGILDGKTVALHTEPQTEAGENQNLDETGQINKIAKDKKLSYKEAYLAWSKQKSEKGELA